MSVSFMTPAPNPLLSPLTKLSMKILVTYHLNKVEVEVVEVEIICPKREMVTQ